MGIEIIGKLTQKNNGDFKLVDLENVDYDGTGKNAKQEIEKKIEDVKNSLDAPTIKSDIQTLKDNEITLVKDETSMEGIKDNEYPTLTTQDKTLIGSINEVNTQCKDIAKNVKKYGVISDAKLIDYTYVVKQRNADGTINTNGTIMWRLNGKKWNGTNNFSIIQDILDLGGSVYFPEGYYFIEGSLNVTNPNTRIYGAGKHKTILCGQFRFYLKNGATNFIIHDLDLLGVGDKLNPPVTIGDTSSSLSDSTVFNWNYMFDIGFSKYCAIMYDLSPIENGIDGITIHDVYCNMYHSLLSGGNNDKVYPRAKNIHVYNCETEYLVWHGVSGRHMENVDVHNCKFSYHFIGMGADFSSGSYNCRFHDNECYKTSSLTKMERKPYTADADKFYVYNNVYTSFNSDEVGYTELYIIKGNCDKSEIYNNTLILLKKFNTVLESSSNDFSFTKNTINLDGIGSDCYIIALHTTKTTKSIKNISNNIVSVSGNLTNVSFVFNSGCSNLLDDNIIIDNNKIIGDILSLFKQSGSTNYKITKLDIINNICSVSRIIHTINDTFTISSLNIKDNICILENKGVNYSSCIDISNLNSDNIIIDNNIYYPAESKSSNLSNFMYINIKEETIKKISITNNKIKNITTKGIVCLNESNTTAQLNIDEILIKNNRIEFIGIGDTWMLGISTNITGDIIFINNYINNQVLSKTDLATKLQSPINFYNSSVEFLNNTIIGNVAIKTYNNLEISERVYTIGDFKMINSQPAWYNGTSWIRADGSVIS